MDSEIKIRRLVLSDLDQLFPLFEQMLKSDIPELATRSEFFLKEDYSKQRIQSSLIYPKIIMLGAFVEDVLVGFLWASSPYAGLGFISWLKVQDKFQKHGIGKALVKEYEEIVKSKKGHVVELYCFESVKHFYEKMGYDVIGIRERGYFELKQFILDKYLD